MTSPHRAVARAVTPSPTVALVTLGCARNDVDSEELAGRLKADGFTLIDDPAGADAVLVNTCGFVEAAKKDSIDTLLAAADLKASHRPSAVVAVGCLAERYGAELAAELPEADAVLGFDDYPDIAARLRRIVAGERPIAHQPGDRRRLLPISPVARPHAGIVVPGHGVQPPDLPDGVAPAAGPRPLRHRLGAEPMAPLKLASGCDRRCSFCAIPSFRGSFVSRPPGDVLAEAEWLAANGVGELFLVSENTTSYGKDLGDLRLLEGLLPRLAAVEAIGRVRLSYLQPAEMRPSLVDAMASIPEVAAYFDLSFQHASGAVLRRMRRFGDGDGFLDLIGSIRSATPTAGIRSNVIVGFPGETAADLDALCDFLIAARLDTVGVFGYSAEDGTEAARLAGQLHAAEIRERVERVSRLVEELTAQRAEDRIGDDVLVLIERVGRDGAMEGRAECQGPEVDGSTRLDWAAGGDRNSSSAPADQPVVGDFVPARVVSSVGVDLVAEPAVAVGAAGSRLSGA